MSKSMTAVGVVLVCLGVIGLLAVALYGSGTLNPATISTPGTTNLKSGDVTTGNTTVYTNLMRNLMADFSKQTYSSNGEQIYLSATDKDGLQVTATFNGTGMPMQGMMNRRVACVNCHGQNARGGFLFPGETTKSADIRWSALADEGFDQASFNKAVTQGVDEKGQALSNWMPRWKISDADLTDLATYLKTL